MDNEKILLYGFIVFAVAILLWSGTSALIPLQKNQQNYDYYNQKNNGGCGDLNDIGNIQHLSHHPKQYADCIKQVSPDMFKKAVGISKDIFMQQNGI